LPKRLENWLVALVSALDEQVDAETRARVLEQCGRRCQTQSLVKKAHGIYQRSKSVDEFLTEFGRVYKHLHREGDHVYIVYPRCYCTFVNKMPRGRVSATWCNCSRGWAKALFEGALGHPVEVVTEQTIVNGDKQCKFKINLK